MRRPSIAVIGGGTGNFNVLTGLKRHDVDLTAIVAMSDSGGSSGRLRDELGQLPPGDVRQCLVALSEDAEQGRVVRQLFTHRFSSGVGLEGHNVGNLLIAALTEITGGHERAIEAASRLLNIRGRVLPVTLTNTHLHAMLTNGEELRSEALIDGRGSQPGIGIDYVFLQPPAYAFPPALDAIADADVIILAPGDLYTSLIANLLVEGIAPAIRASKGKVVYITNLMTKPGETDELTAEDFVGEIGRYLGDEHRINAVIVNSRPFTDKIVARYRQMGAHPVHYDAASLRKVIPEVVERDLLAEGVFVRHDPDKVAEAVMSLLPAATDSIPALSGKVRGREKVRGLHLVNE